MPHYNIHATFVNFVGKELFTTTVLIQREILIGMPAWHGQCDLEPWMSVQPTMYRLDLHDELEGQSLIVYVSNIGDDGAAMVGNGDSFPTPNPT